MAERDLQQEIRLALGMDPRVVLFRNNCGMAEKDGRKIRYGVASPGGSDLIGVLRDSGRFVAIEIKTTRGRVSEDQQLFLNLVRACGGFACVVRSVEDAVQAIERASAGCLE